ncbi:MAG: GGDEF domain-containing protein [Devosia sp.]|uniref:GGDEF domain-containing protein n=1 Tax=Devosia sp. TaxID=1871048 RepID=UPI001A582288|nr:GGDEF domain-containing protein [Devosia sp.]MBL8599699.1 GGDEF domain-containing protein [Devosia sp.]
MKTSRIDFSAVGWGRVIAVTTAGTLLCIAITVYVDSFNFRSMSEASRLRALLTDFLLPIVFCVPVLGFFMMKLRELAIAHRKLTILASTDALTQVMNRAAFSTLVDAYLRDVRAAEDKARGALLIIDADNFKTINDRFGHDHGDEALVTIARSIKSMLRTPDLVGRIGGEEFGVFLPGATTEQATHVAERIRQSVDGSTFMAAGARQPLSVSVGGAVFERDLPYADLFRLADQQLYAAKRDGRNRVVIAPVRPGPLALVAA